MTVLANTVASGFASRFESIAAKPRKCVERLSNEQFWRNGILAGTASWI